MPYPNEHSARVRAPEDFDKKAYRRVKGGKLYGTKVPNTVSIIWGKLKGKAKPSDPPVLQALRFDKTSWTITEVKQWLTARGLKYIKLEPAAKTEKKQEGEGESMGAKVLEIEMEDIAMMGDTDLGQFVRDKLKIETEADPIDDDDMTDPDAAMSKLTYENMRKLSDADLGALIKKIAKRRLDTRLMTIGFYADTAAGEQEAEPESDDSDTDNSEDFYAILDDNTVYVDMKALTTAERNALPDADFALIQTVTGKDSAEQRIRRFQINDAPSRKALLSGLAQAEDVTTEERAKAFVKLYAKGKAAGDDWVEKYKGYDMSVYPPKPSAKAKKEEVSAGETALRLYAYVSGRGLVPFQMRPEEDAAGQLATHDDDAGKTEEFEGTDDGIVDVDDMAVFKSGKFNGKSYNEADLDEMVKNFGLLRDQVQPPLKLSHGDEKSLRNAFGWMSSLYRKGSVLYASFKQIPRKVAELIKKGAWKRPSAEIYLDYKDENGKSYGKVMAAVALLGADPPAVKGLPALTSLEAIASLYHAAKEHNATEVYLMEFEETTEEQTTTEESTEEETTGTDQTVNDKPKTESKEETPKQNEGGDQDMTTNEDLVKQVKVLQDTVAAQQKELEQAKTDKRNAEEAAFLDARVKEGKLLPAMRTGARRLFDSLAPLEKITFTETKDGKETSVESTPYAEFKALLATMPTMVNLGEESAGGRPDDDTAPKAKDEVVVGKKEQVANADLDEAVKKYQEEHTDMTYEQALTDVVRLGLAEME